jgi:membrane associated rhomboid family serine protease
MPTPAVRLLILCNVVVYLLEQLLGVRLFTMLALWPFGPRFHPWQVFTYAFIHGGFAHIAFNMLGLAVFGTDLERVWGSARLINCYLLSVLSAAATQLVYSAVIGSWRHRSVHPAACSAYS